MASLLKSIFGSSNDRIVRALQPTVNRINALEAEFEKLSDSELAAKTPEFKARLEKGETLDDILPEAFATVREAAKRTLGQRHYDVQLMGGLVLHQGKIAEMRTGEGKTLVSTLPTYLNALTGKGVHVVTVNDYLAKRDAEWMGQIHRFLGLSVGLIMHNLPDFMRQEAYGADITYGTNNEYGFDYLRDNMKFSRREMVQRPFNYAIVDEVDSILIDEARTPLIISGPVEDNTTLYLTMNKFIPKLNNEDYAVDEKARTCTFTEDGTEHLEQILRNAGLLKEGTVGLYDIENIALVHHANQALRAHKLFTKDKDYIVKDNAVMIIDEFTGRMMEGRRYSEGLHQALEAKEGVKIQRENQTLASITFQNYFRMYPKLSGMTGTAMTEANEFEDIYKLQVVEIPTHVPVQRIDDDDQIYRTEEDKFAAIVKLIKEANAKQQPVLVGTASIEKSELVSKYLKKEKIAHNILNARHHEREAHIIALAGIPGAVTVATNMAGRGTDIQLGGNVEMLAEDKIREDMSDTEKQKVLVDIKEQVARDRDLVRQAGGLCVIGTERHESRRIDNQLRGRSGRQGDPGYSRFFLSSQDDLIRIFGADKKMDWVLGTMGEPGEPISHPMITRMMEKSQQKVEARNYDIRKNLLKFDDVMNDQRKVIFEQRIELMEAEDAEDTIKDMVADTIEDLVAYHVPQGSYAEQWDITGLETEIFRLFGLKLPVADWAQEEGIAEQEISERLHKAVEELLADKKARYSDGLFKDVSRRMLLFTLDELWKDHLHSLDHLRQGIGLRGYAQKDPLNEYKREAFGLFAEMLNKLRETVITRLCHLEMANDGEGISVFDRRQVKMEEHHPAPTFGGAEAEERSAPRMQETVHNRVKAEDRDPMNPDSWGRIGRNEPCPCGSGKKYKQCHGALG